LAIETGVNKDCVSAVTDIPPFFGKDKKKIWTESFQVNITARILLKTEKHP